MRQTPRLRRGIGAMLLFIGLFTAAVGNSGEAGPPATAAAASTPEPVTARVIVKYRADTDLMRRSLGARGAPARPLHAQALSQRLRMELTDGRILGARTQGLRARGISSAQLAAQLAAQPDVEWAVPDERRYIRAMTNDPFLAGGQTTITPTVGQWYLRAPDATARSAINAVGAWDTTTGSPAVTVAVLDTGVRPHPELATKLRPGYDFIHVDSVANDGGGGRDADATDPGDFELAGDCPGFRASTSSWHGTKVAGLIGASTNDGVGMAGVGYNVMVLPVRVLGKCGGFDSDIIAAMRWAGGLTAEVGFGTSVTFPNNHPARVINMSLGSAGTCPASYADVIAELATLKVTVIVAAGNEDGLAVNSPANCPGAIAVGGLRHSGTKVGYSSVGRQVAIAAPAGNCVNLVGPCLFPLLTTTNSSPQQALPNTDNTYSDSIRPTFGTSFAAPLVAGTVGLMLSVNPTMGPDQVRRALQSSATTFVSSGAAPDVPICRAPDGVTQIECYCTTTTCGAGMLNAALAVVHALNPFVVVSSETATPVAGSFVALDGSSSAAQGPRTITAYQWSIVSGAELASFSGATNGPTASLRTAAAGSVTVQLAVTDNTGAIGRGEVTLSVVAPAPAGGGGGGGGGGGAIDFASLTFLFAVAVGALWARHGRRRRC
ncbi:MAG: S8 family peptidase [Rhodoferax sp.]|nr:S8 family peptidase [Rhodoferax sp.]